MRCNASSCTPPSARRRNIAATAASAVAARAVRDRVVVGIRSLWVRG
jgi:hypothetical protein